MRLTAEHHVRILSWLYVRLLRLLVGPTSRLSQICDWLADGDYVVVLDECHKAKKCITKEKGGYSRRDLSLHCCSKLYMFVLWKLGSLTRQLCTFESAASTDSASPDVACRAKTSHVQANKDKKGLGKCLFQLCKPCTYLRTPATCR